MINPYLRGMKLHNLTKDQEKQPFVIGEEFISRFIPIWYSRLMKSVLCILSHLLLLFPMVVRSQSPLDTLVMRAIMVNQLFPQEKVYLHFDNTSYYLGETMWFKAYVVGTGDHTLYPQSKVLYVELVAPEGYVVETKKYKLDDKGCCSGEFELRESILSGYYTVRAYTRYMLNWGDEAIFSRTFPVYDAVASGHYEIKDMLDRRQNPLLPEEKRQSGAKRYRLDFYPEGGHLVDGMPCVVAYELLRYDGKPMKDTITVYEEKRQLLRTAPEHNGKGAFQLTPRKGMQYHVEVKYGADNSRGRTKEHKSEFALPAVEREGVSIAVREEADSFILDIRNNLEGDVPLGCAILNKGRMQLYEPFNSSVRHKTVTLHQDSLPEGVNRLVVFAGHGTPLAERQFFVRHDRVHPDDLHCVRLNVTTSEGVPIEDAELEPYEKVTLRIAREDGKPISPEASLSLSVTDADSREDIGTGGNLYTHLLLGSELRGYIPDAFRYFDPKNVNRSRELDLVMLTHGWTSYDWSVLSSRFFDLKHPIERGITVKGELLEFAYSKSKRHQKEEIPVSYEPQTFHTMVFSMQKDSILQEYDFTTDIDGSFCIHTEDFNGNRIVSLSSRQKATRHRRPIVVIDKHFSPKTLPEQYMRFSFSESLQAEMIKVGNLEYLLPDVEIDKERRENRYHLPPVSKVRFNYLDEWERNYDDYWRMRKALLDNEEGGDIAEDSILTNYNGPWYMAPIRCYKDRFGNVFIADEGTAPYKVVGAAFLRNFIGCYWLHYLVADSDCLSDSLFINDEYLKQMDFLNPFNFKEFFISSDWAVRRKFPNDSGFWAEKYSAISKKNIRSFTGTSGTYHQPKWGLDYYHGFYANQILPPAVLAKDYASCERFLVQATGASQWIVNTNTGRYFARGTLPMDVPNYVACLVPYTDEERDSLYIPNGDNGWNHRFTHLQGYSQSKQFYAPDYSKCRLRHDRTESRRTLLWSTDFLQDSTGVLTTSFCKSPQVCNIAVSIEGMDARFIFSNETVHIQDTQHAILPSIHNDLRIWRSVVDTLQSSPSELIAMHQNNVEGIRKLHEQQVDDAVMLFKKSAMMMYPPAMANLGICYHRGWGVDKDVDMAYKYYLLAAERGDASACHNLGGCYLNGEAVPCNDSLAFVWYQRAAEKGYAQSQVMLGKFYEMGLHPVQQSDSIALTYYLPAAERYPEAAFSAALILASRDSILGLSEKILRKSQTISLIEHAAQQGLLAAQKYLADCYRDGHYVRKSKKRMAEYIAICAQQGDEQSLLRLARCLELGIGIKRNAGKAYEYYKQLGEKGYEYARKKVFEYEYYGDFGFDRTQLKNL